MHKTQPRDFPGSAVVKTALSVQGSIPGGGAKILHATWHDQPPPQPPPHENKTKNPKQKQRVKQTNKKPSTNACYGSVVFQRNHCLLLPGILKIVFIDTCYMAGTLHHNILGCVYYSHPPEEEMKVQRHSQGPIAAKWQVRVEPGLVLPGGTVLPDALHRAMAVLCISHPALGERPFPVTQGC